MESENPEVRLTSSLTDWRQTTSPRFHLQLTTAERRFLLTFVDLLLVNGALLAAVTIWNEFSPTFPVVIAHAKWFVTLSVVWFGFSRILDIYNLARAASTTTIIGSAGIASLLTGLLYLFIPWLTPPILSRSYAYGFLLISTVMVIVWRVFYAQVLAQPAFRQRTLILGTGDTARELQHSLSKANQANDANPFRGTGYQVIGLVADKPGGQLSEDESIALGNVEQLVRLARIHKVDEIIVAPTDQQVLERNVYDLLLDCHELGLRVSSYASIYERLTARLPVAYAQSDLQLVLGQADGPAVRLYSASKRGLDIVLALCGLAVLGLLAPFIALCNALWSSGPLLYRQQRVGKGGRPFVVLKFRSMCPEAEESTGTVWCHAEDERVTSVGRWLRKTRLDELPQFLNVLRGDMSVIGPRPERTHFVGLLSAQMPLYRARHAVKPGITGWAQVNCSYGDSIEGGRVKLEYDLYYIKHASLYLDLAIMLKTLAVILGLQGR